MLDGIAAATRWAALATLSTGLVVLIGAAAAGERRRIYEAAVLKTLGATRGRILASFALRAALDRRRGRRRRHRRRRRRRLGGDGLRARRRLPLRAAANALAIVAGGALASLLAGLAFALRPLAARPARVLRARE